jgi:hypothetical protein
MSRAWEENEEIVAMVAELNEPVNHKELRALGGTITKDDIENSDLYKALEAFSLKWFTNDDRPTRTNS